MIALCERFGCLPSALMREPADLLRLVGLVDRYRARPEGGEFLGE